MLKKIEPPPTPPFSGGKIKNDRCQQTRFQKVFLKVIIIWQNLVFKQLFLVENGLLLPPPPLHWVLMWYLNCECDYLSLMPDYPQKCRIRFLIMVPIQFWWFFDLVKKHFSSLKIGELRAFFENSQNYIKNFLKKYLRVLSTLKLAYTVLWDNSSPLS